MILSNTFKITKVKAKTKARLFKDVKEGDVLTFSMSIENTTSGRGNYATTIDVVKSGGSIEWFSQSELSNVLNRCFELEEFKV